ncbi:hypothetical protein CC80DRAFT_551411 [Byssothecium circinans]|uniref:Uncharacterized protein n=1 Tax=Byssothecium circinans TaxID=147558 RepID=A0A6A5TLV2_9PLEO|nr:hypothetical protein CC80DRAFT_551411 [Byssothecium circinans]
MALIGVRVSDVDEDGFKLLPRELREQIYLHLGYPILTRRLHTCHEVCHGYPTVIANYLKAYNVTNLRRFKARLMLLSGTMTSREHEQFVRKNPRMEGVDEFWEWYKKGDVIVSVEDGWMWGRDWEGVEHTVRPPDPGLLATSQVFYGDGIACFTVSPSE